MSQPNTQMAMVAVNKLKGHALTDYARTKDMIAQLSQRPVLEKPIVVDRSTKMVVDGHHRLEAFMDLGFRKIPCLMVDYFSDDIEMEVLENDKAISKRDVVKRARTGKLFAPNIVRHHIKASWASIECALTLPMGGRLCAQPA